MPQIPDQFFRFCDVKEHAEQMCEGYIYLSTFDYIRGCDRARADSAEGTLTYNTGDETVWVDGEPATEAARNVQASGLHGIMPPARYQSMSGNTIHMRVPDALVLCMTSHPGDDKFRRVFGEYRVTITRLLDFHRAVHWALQKEIEAPDGLFAPLLYVGRQISAEQSAIMEPAIVGPEVNAWEQEQRMVWYPKSPGTAKPIRLCVPDVKGFCKIE